MDLLDKLYTIHKLKEIDRTNMVKDRQETTAEHVYSTLLLAQYFMKIVPNINFEKVNKMIMYHDMVEIHAGDTFVLNKEGLEDKEERELEAMKKLCDELPDVLVEDFKSIFEEFEAGETRDAKFAKAVDVFDPIIQAIKHPQQWARYGFTEEVLRESKEKYFVDFPEIQKVFEEIIVELHKRKIIPSSD